MKQGVDGFNWQSHSSSSCANYYDSDSHGPHDFFLRRLRELKGLKIIIQLGQVLFHSLTTKIDRECKHQNDGRYLTFFLKMGLYMLWARMVLTDRKLESVEDMTAADTAPRPMNETTGGVRYWSTMGRINVLSSSTEAVWLVVTPSNGLYDVWVQSGWKQ